MKTIITYIAPFLILFGFASCEGETTRNWFIKNNSSGAIIVTDHSIKTNEVSSVTIPSGSSQVIEITYQRGGSTRADFASETFYSITVINALGDTTTKDCINEGSWIYEIIHRKKVPSIYEQNYYLQLSDSDF